MPDHKMELHGFCDASKVGIGAVIFIQNIELKCVTFFLVAKAKVVPKKDEHNSKLVTIPRLELCAASLDTHWRLFLIRLHYAKNEN